MSRLGSSVRPLYALSWLWGWWGGGPPNNEDVSKKSNFTVPDNKEMAGVDHHPMRHPSYSYDRFMSQSKVEPPPYTRHDQSGAIKRCQLKVEQLMSELGIPGLVVGVSVKQQRVWSSAFGYCDVENMTLCKPDSIMRIASISKSITMATAVAKLIEENKLNLSESIHKYLNESEFPMQQIQGTYYDINLKQLLSNTSGIRHYHDDSSTKALLPIGSPKSIKAYQTKSEIERIEHYSKKNYKNVIESLAIFKNDDLTCKPGTKFAYTTYGWVLVSAIVQKVLEKDDRFEDHLMKVIKQDLGMKNTYLDQEEPIIFNRGKYYSRNGNLGRLLNAPSVDLSCKWAGGGLLSRTDDLLQLANVLLHSYKGRENSFLKSETVKSMWTPVVPVRQGYESYGLGFFVGSDNYTHDPNLELADFDPRPKAAPYKFYVYHPGGAVGASSMLLILPEEEIAVAIIVNLSDVNLYDLAFSILKEFA